MDGIYFKLSTAPSSPHHSTFSLSLIMITYTDVIVL